MSKGSLLILFVKNPRLGRVKTRLAATLGDKQALEIYNRLLGITHREAGKLAEDKEVWYSDFIDQNDLFESGKFKKKLQQGENLGERMWNAVSDAFDSGYRRVIVIGSDCPDIDAGILHEAFEKLNHADTVLGPSKDGGYYLIGFSKLIPEVFRNISWSTSQVLSQTREILVNVKTGWVELRALNDIDTEEDLKLSGLLDE